MPLESAVKKCDHVRWGGWNARILGALSFFMVVGVQMS